MPTGTYDRLRTWAENNGETLSVRKAQTADGSYWMIDITISDPVSFSTSGDGRTIDDAAAQVLSDLTTVGVSIPD